MFKLCLIAPSCLFLRQISYQHDGLNYSNKAYVLKVTFFWKTFVCDNFASCFVYSMKGLFVHSASFQNSFILYFLAYLLNLVLCAAVKSILLQPLIWWRGHCSLISYWVWRSRLTSFNLDFTVKTSWMSHLLFPCESHWFLMVKLEKD